jgi:hypothetical protein
MRAATRERVMTERMIRIMARGWPGGNPVFQLSWSGCRRCADCFKASTQRCAINVT